MFDVIGKRFSSPCAPAGGGTPPCKGNYPPLKGLIRRRSKSLLTLIQLIHIFEYNKRMLLSVTTVIAEREGEFMSGPSDEKDLYKRMEVLEAENKKLRLQLIEYMRREEELDSDEFEDEDYNFYDLFDIDEIQTLQDAFASLTGVASIITLPDGTPVTTPSNFCRLCNDIIRQTEKGLANCMHSDSIIGSYNPDGPTIQPCLSGGLWDAGASVHAGKKHVANWLIGQVRADVIDEQKLLDYAADIGADVEAFRKALQEVPVMSIQKFREIAQVLHLFANLLSKTALQNLRQKRSLLHLSGLLPICASCKKIRDDSGYWNQIESYIARHSQAMFSHGICPDCLKKQYPKYYEKMQARKKE